MAYKYENHGKIFKEEKDRADQYEKLYTELKQPFDDIKKEAHRLKLNLVKYEQKYGFIDIGKLHEQVASSTTKYEAAKKEAASYHKDLLDLRKQIMQATQKFDRGSSNDGGKRGRKRRDDDEPWKGGPRHARHDALKRGPPLRDKQKCATHRRTRRRKGKVA